MRLATLLFLILPLLTYGQQDSSFTAKTSKYVGSANLRSEPNVLSPVIGTVPPNSIVTILENSGQSYLKIKYDDKEGYILASMLEENSIPKKRSTYSSSSSSSSSTSSQSKPKARSSSTYTPKKRSSYRRYITGPRGGCYYINSNGNKVYVSRSLCN
jgi:uncharacterized protein YgiM (DUF1202 family)